MVNKKYRGLGFIGLILKGIGILELLIGIASLILFPLVLSDSAGGLQQFGFNNLLPGTELMLGIIFGLIIFLIGTVCGLLTYSMGEIFNLLIAIEENTRATLRCLQEQPLTGMK